MSSSFANRDSASCPSGTIGTCKKDLDATILSDPEQAWTIIERDLFEAASGPAYDAIKHVARTGKCAILSSWSLAGAARAHQELGVPLCRVYLSPHAVTLSAKTVDGPASRELAFFPEWFGTRQPGWPARLTHCGFPFLQRCRAAALPPALETFLASGDPPVVFTPGSFRRNPGAFFRQSREVCIALGLRAVFLSPNGMEALQGLPPTMIHFHMCHCNGCCRAQWPWSITAGSGLAHRPCALRCRNSRHRSFFDQFDNARIIEQLGIGQTLPARDYNAQQAAQILGQIVAITKDERPLRGLLPPNSAVGMRRQRSAMPSKPWPDRPKEGHLQRRRRCPSKLGGIVLVSRPDFASQREKMLGVKVPLLSMSWWSRHRRTAVTAAGQSNNEAGNGARSQRAIQDGTVAQLSLFDAGRSPW